MWECKSKANRIHILAVFLLLCCSSGYRNYLVNIGPDTRGQGINVIIPNNVRIENVFFYFITLDSKHINECQSKSWRCFPVILPKQIIAGVHMNYLFSVYIFKCKRWLLEPLNTFSSHLESGDFMASALCVRDPGWENTKCEFPHGTAPPTLPGLLALDR